VKLFCLAEKVIRLPAVKSYALEEPPDEQGKRRQEKEVDAILARIKRSKGPP
jgi:hypothetical protein